jgi:glycine hydroxymethyltransferase
VLGRAGMTVNKNKIPFDPEPPTVTSGVRIGTPAVTTRGLKEAEMVALAGLIDRALKAKSDDAALDKIHEEVKLLCRSFPLYQDMPLPQDRPS